MLTLGIAGGFDLIQQRRHYIIRDGACHDSAAVLVEDGRVVAAAEEERLNRIKHTNKAPVNAINFCLAERGIRMADIDAVAVYGSEEICSRMLERVFYRNVDAKPATNVRGLIHDFLQRGTGQDIDDEKLVFVNHHLAHGACACMQSGFSESLVLTLDGEGDCLSGSVAIWSDSNYHILKNYPVSHSLGYFYLTVIAMIGYKLNEEYKVMGLAPYGNPDRLRSTFAELYELLPHGEFAIHWDRMDRLYGLAPPRKVGDPILEVHKNIAAALQESLEAIVFHVLRHFQNETSAKSLCVGGGVAHNSTLNGKLLYSGIFDHIFVHPSSHDAGCALGAALYSQGTAFSTDSIPQIQHVYWGTNLGPAEMVEAELELWNRLIEFEYVPDIAVRTANLLATGNVIGWVQGRAEFGPRALGNRSIVADPRPSANKELVNRMVKKREAYRPFAPSVMLEHVAEYFEVSEDGLQFPFMSFTLKVRPEKAELLGATTHVDGTSRVQTVSRDVNPVFWQLIEAFRQATGVAAVLNTSFNNYAEPIVDSAEDAIVCFLTTGLHYLVIGRYLIKKRIFNVSDLLYFSVDLRQYSTLTQTKALKVDRVWAISYYISNTYGSESIPISETAFRILLAPDQRSVRELLEELELSVEPNTLAQEIFQLWEKRTINLRPIR